MLSRPLSSSRLLSSDRLLSLSRLLFVACAFILSHGCGNAPAPPQEAMEAPPPPPETNPVLDTAQAGTAESLPPPTNAEVVAAVERVFKGVVTSEAGRKLYFTVGDFNGDDSEDIAVVVRPAPGRLAEINDELAAWIVRTPMPLAASARKDLPDSAAHTEVAGGRVLIAEGDRLLAVIHGFGAEGWRDPQATQTYVLKNATGEGMKTQVSEQILSAAPEKRLPRPRGDVIAQAIGGQSGFLYYDGANYTWYDPRSYTSAPPARMAHGGVTVAAQQ